MKLSRKHSFKKLIQPYLAQLYRLALRYTGNQYDAEDLVQDMVVKLYPRQEELEQIDNLATWLNKILYRMYIDKVRQLRSSRVQTVSALAQDDIEGDSILDTSTDGMTPESSLSMLRDIERVQIALDQLNDDQRVVIMLHDVEGYPLEEIEKITGLPVGTVKSRLHRGRLRLKTLLLEGTFLSADPCNKAGDNDELLNSKNVYKRPH